MSDDYWRRAVVDRRLRDLESMAHRQVDFLKAVKCDPQFRAAIAEAARDDDLHDRVDRIEARVQKLEAAMLPLVILADRVDRIDARLQKLESLAAAGPIVIPADAELSAEPVTIEGTIGIVDELRRKGWVEVVDGRVYPTEKAKRLYEGEAT